MWTNRRTFCVQDYATFPELATALLTHTSSTLCTGFSSQGLVLVNDSTSEDALQEYAVFDGREQIESLTTSWMDEARLVEVLTELRDKPGYDSPGRWVQVGSWDLTLQPPQEHPRCSSCA
jgi:hypothetical protein